MENTRIPDIRLDLSGITPTNVSKGTIEEFAYNPADIFGGGGGSITGFATETTQTAILNELQIQNAYSTTTWVDANDIYFMQVVGSDPLTGQPIVSAILSDGTPFSPAQPTVPVGGNDTQSQSSQYIADVNGTGYTAGDLITQTLITQTVAPFAVLTTFYYNNNTGAVITPVFSHLSPFNPPLATEVTLNDVKQNTSLLLLSTERLKANINNTATVGDIIIKRTFRDSTGAYTYEFYNETTDSMMGNSFPASELSDINTPAFRTNMTWNTYAGGGIYSLLSPNPARKKVMVKHTNTNFAVDPAKPINFLWNDGSSSPDNKTHSWQFVADFESIVFEGSDICQLELLANCDIDFELTIEEWI